MISHSRTYLETSMGNQIIGPVPYYSQAVMFWLSKLAAQNPHLFMLRDFDSHARADRIIASCFGAEMHIYADKDIVCYCTSSNDFVEKIDKKHVTLIDYTCRCEAKNAKVVHAIPPFCFEDYRDMFPTETQSRVSRLNITCFIRDQADAENIIQIWINNEIRGNLYLFRALSSDFDPNFYCQLEKVNRTDIRGKKIELFCYDNIEPSKIVNALVNSSVAIFFARDTVYQFWSLILKCYPVIFKDDVLSSVIKYLSSEDRLEDLIISFCHYPRQLQQLVAELSSIRLHDLQLSNFFPLEN